MLSITLQIAGTVTLLVSGLPGQIPLYRLTMPSTWEYSGWSIAAAGDANGDGFGDVLIGAPGFNWVTPGRIGVVSGRDGALLFTRAGNLFDEFGSSVALVGDLNGDGTGDLIASSGGPTGGSSWVLSGRDGTILYTVPGGTSAAACGDTDADGVPDFMTGDIRQAAGAGGAFLFSGRTGQLRYQWIGLRAGDTLGAVVAGVGDLNRDGYGDVAAAASQIGFTVPNRICYVNVYSGFDGSLLRTVAGMAAGDEFGTSICGTGDLDGDGFPDLAIGAPQCVTLSSCTGGGYVQELSGRDGHLIRTLTGPAQGSQFGTSLANVGDLDGDGVPDLAVGAPGVGAPLARHGCVFVYSGASGALLGQICGRGSEGFGRSLAAMGDINGDGVPDLGVGTSSAFRGATYVFSGVGGAVVMGQGCGSGAIAPVARAASAHVGQPWTVGGFGGPAAAAGVLLLGRIPEMPTRLNSACSAYLDPGALWFAVPIASDPTAVWSATLPVPMDINLIGALLAAQTLLARPASPGAMDATNGVYLQIQR